MKTRTILLPPYLVPTACFTHIQHHRTISTNLLVHKQHAQYRERVVKYRAQKWNTMQLFMQHKKVYAGSICWIGLRTEKQLAKYKTVNVHINRHTAVINHIHQQMHIIGSETVHMVLRTFMVWHQGTILRDYHIQRSRTTYTSIWEGTMPNTKESLCRP
jgi:hypothetical protein